MNQITSTDMTNAISAAQFHPAIHERLNRRDADKRLDCRSVRCDVRSAIDAPIKLFQIVFNYDFVSGQETKKEDITAEVEINRHGEVRVTRWNAI